MVSLYSLGTVQSYAKMQKTKNLWEERKQSGYYRQLAQSSPDKASVQEQFDRMNSDSSDTVLEEIRTKLKLGKELSPTEKEKIRQSDPQLYEKVKQIEQERRQYAESLKQCKTKDDVQRLKLNKLAASVHKLQSVSSDPYIPLDKKLGIALEESMKNAAFCKEESRFIKSGAYASLPTDEERLQAIQDEREQVQPLPPPEESEKPDDTPPKDAPPADAEQAGNDGTQSGVKPADQDSGTHSSDAGKTDTRKTSPLAAKAVERYQHQAAQEENANRSRRSRSAARG